MLTFLSETPDLGTDRRKGTVFVLLRAEATGIGSVGRIHRLLQQVRKVVRKIRSRRTRLRHDIGGNVPSLFGGELWIEILGAVRHVEVDEVGDGDEPRHSRTVIEAVRAPERRDVYPRSEDGMLRRCPDPSVLWQSAHLRA